MHHRSRAWGVTCLVLALGLPLAAEAQVTVPVWPQVRVGVLAVDAKGKPLSSLAAGDLVVKENGHPMKVEAVIPATKPISLCLLVDLFQSPDTNAPTRKERWDDMREAVDRFVQSLPADDEICLASFSMRGSRSIAQGFTLSRQSIMEHFDLLDDGREYGNPSSLINVSVYMRGRSSYQDRSVVLISFLPETALIAPTYWNSLRRTGMPVLHVIQVPRLHSLGIPGAQSDHESDEKTNRQLAKMGGGFSYFPWDKKELNASVDHLSDALKNRYVLTYESENQTKDGLQRRVDVELDKVHQKERDVVSAPEGYYAPSR